MSPTDNPHPDEQWVIPPEPAAELPVARWAGRFTGAAKVLAPAVAALLVGGGAAFAFGGHQSSAGASVEQSGATAILGGTRPSASGESRDNGESGHSRDSDDSGEPADGD